MSRHERKMKRNATFAELDKQKAEAARSKAEAAESKRQREEQWRKDHPVSAGLIPLVDYVPPRGDYRPA